MVFYEIQILSVPQIKFAWNVKIERYKNKFSYKEDFLEIALCREGRILFEYENGEKEITHPKMLLPMFSDISCKTSAYENERQRHVTVGFNLKYNLSRYDSEKENDISSIRKRVEERQSILIPHHCDMGEYYEEVKNLLLKICSENRKIGSGRKLSTIGYCHVLFGVLTDFVLKRLKEEKPDVIPSEALYAEKAEEYIMRNYAKKITIKDISEYLGISEGYLHRIFKNVKNCTVLEFINRHRIYVATELMENQSLSLREAAYNVGIDDPCYMSRLFKKVTGISYRDYLKNAKAVL